MKVDNKQEDIFKYNRHPNCKQQLNIITIAYTGAMFIICLVTLIAASCTTNHNMVIAIILFGLFGCIIETGFYILFRKEFKK